MQRIRKPVPGGGLGPVGPDPEPWYLPFGDDTGYANGPEAGLFQGNGDLYTSFWNEAHSLTWSVGKTDVWDRRYFGAGKRIVTLAEIRELALTPEITRITNATPGLPGSAHVLYRAYDYPCPKPVGQVILRAPALQGAATYLAELDMTSALLKVGATQGEHQLRVTSLVCPLRNVLVLTATCPQLALPLRLELYRHRDTLQRGQTMTEMAGSLPRLAYDYDQDAGNGPLDPPEVGSDGRFFWVRQRFPGEMTFPQGFEVVMMALIPDQSYEITVHQNILGAGAKVPLKELSPAEWRMLHGAWKEKRLAIQMVNDAPGWLATATLSPRPGSPLTAYVSVMTTRDATNPFLAAQQELLAAVEAGPEQLAREHVTWWRAFWDRSTVETNGPHFDTALQARTYRLGWSARAGKVPINNISQYVFTDATPWHGDYHFNEIWLHPILIANHAQALLPWLQMLEEMLPMAQANARDVYGCRGCCYPLIHYPLQSTHVIYSSQIWELGLELTAMVLKTFWQYVRFTGDRDYLREHAYPILREGARFYADYVHRGEDGHYHIIPTVSQEHWGLTQDFRLNRDSVGALSQARYHLLACAEAAEMLGLDEAERTHWREIAQNLAPYPTYQTPAGPIFVDVRGNTPENPLTNLPADLAMVNWGDQIHLETDPELLEIARRTYRLQYLERGRYTHAYYRATFERRLGLPRTIDYFDVEDLLMSFTGRIYLFSGLPSGQNARFERLLAWGGFEVSAEKTNGRVQWVRLKSLAGEPCRLTNPWPGQQVAIREQGGTTSVPYTLEYTRGECLTFDTLQGATYLCAPGNDLSIQEAQTPGRHSGQG